MNATSREAKASMPLFFELAALVGLTTDQVFVEVMKFDR